ncbi:aminotransferase class IV [Methylobacterium sp. WSM2598]|uniref:aminotransferase class IV n=1 Tax=Methylobacterium sp. WSM2598 TaxID=398261 RepID=UPI000367053C|nr:aminotransferase class IV [Methylobacterium sp. WSM2598]
MPWLDGALVEGPTLPLDPADRGLTLGDGVFDTALVRDGRVIFEAAHVARLVASAAALGFPLDPAAVTAGMHAMAAGRERAALRTTATRGSGPRGLRPPPAPRPRLLVTAAPLADPGTAFAPLALRTTGIRRNDTSPTSRHKTLGYLDAVLAAEEAARAGADEALFLNTRGRVACAGTGSLFALIGGALVTPPLADGVLAGIVRGWILARAPDLGIAAQERSLRPEDLAGAEALFVTNSLRLIAPVRALDGRACRDGLQDGRIRRLADALREEVASHSPP